MKWNDTYFVSPTGRYVLVKGDGFAIAEIDGKFMKFTDVSFAREQLDDNSQWLAVTDKETITRLDLRFSEAAPTVTEPPEAVAPSGGMAPLSPPLIQVSRNSAYGGGVVLIVLAVWAYFGFPSPETLADWPTAANQCVKFADDNKQKLFFGSEEQVRAIGSWLKKGRIVVEVGAFEPGEKSFIPRLCVVGRGRIEIVSILENAAWR